MGFKPTTLAHESDTLPMLKTNMRNLKHGINQENDDFNPPPYRCTFPYESCNEKKTGHKFNEHSNTDRLYNIKSIVNFSYLIIDLLQENHSANGFKAIESKVLESKSSISSVIRCSLDHLLTVSHAIST